MKDVIYFYFIRSYLIMINEFATLGIYTVILKKLHKFDVRIQTNNIATLQTPQFT